MRRYHFLRIGLLVALLGACSGTELQVPIPASDEALGDLSAQMSKRSDLSAHSPYWHETLDELLPNVRWGSDGDEGFTRSDAIVIGKVVDVQKGSGFIPLSEDITDRPNGDGERVDFDDQKALWRTVHVTMDVEESIGAQVDSQIRIGMPFVTDRFETTAGGLKALDRIAVFLIDGGAPYQYDKSLYGVALDGTAVLRIDNDGSLEAPFRVEEAKELGPVPTLEDLRTAASGPERRVVLARSGTQQYRPASEPKAADR